MFLFAHLGSLLILPIFAEIHPGSGLYNCVDLFICWYSENKRFKIETGILRLTLENCLIPVVLLIIILNQNV